MSASTLITFIVCEQVTGLTIWSNGKFEMSNVFRKPVREAQVLQMTCRYHHCTHARSCIEGYHWATICRAYLSRKRVQWFSRDGTIETSGKQNMSRYRLLASRLIQYSPHNIWFGASKRTIRRSCLVHAQQV